MENRGGPAVGRPRMGLSAGELLAVLVTALVGLGAGLLWVALMALVDSWVEMTETMLAWMAGSIAVGGVVGLCLGLVGRPILLLVWLPAAAVGAVVAAQFDVELAGDEEAVYLVMLYSALVAAPAVVGSVFGLAIRRARTDRSPRALIITIVVAAVIAATFLIPGIEPAWRLVVLVGAMWLGWRQRKRNAHPDAGRFTR